MMGNRDRRYWSHGNCIWLGFFAAIASISLLAAPLIAATNPVPSRKTAPQYQRTHFGAPLVKSESRADGEVVTLSNDAAKVAVRIDAERHVRVTSLRTGSGYELLSGPAACFTVVDKQGSVVKDGGEFRCESWSPRYCEAYAEIEITLLAPEKVIWRLRLYCGKPYLEQLFEMPDDWRVPGHAVRQTLGAVPALKPVMPNRVWERGFSHGRPVDATRDRFEFVEQSDHLSYDAGSGSGLAAFVAGIGGEEVISGGAFALSDRVTPTLGAAEPIARFILWPFDGPVETAFAGLRRFMSDEYVTKAQFPDRLTWTQFFTWQWVPKKPIQSAGPNDPYYRGQVTADRILDVLPRLVSTGYEQFHLDAGWEKGFQDDEWQFDPVRFPDGFGPIRAFLREHSMPMYIWWGISDITARKPAEVMRLIEETDVTHIFFDRLLGDESIPAIREIRKRYPSFTCMNHFAPSHSKAYANSGGAGLNPHLLSELSLSYFGEEEYFKWSNILPAKPGEAFSTHSIAAGDLVTRSCVYYAGWAMPFRSLYVPAWPWAALENRPIQELANRFNTLLAARIGFEWGEDPRDLPREAADLFLDGCAFYKAIRPFRGDYQHILGAPDGIHPDGIAHLKNGRGYVFIFNPGDKATHVSWKDLFWEPDLELDPDTKLTITDWTKYLSPRVTDTVDLRKPRGGIRIGPQSSVVLGVNIDLKTTLAEAMRQRSLTRRMDARSPSPPAKL